VPRWARSLVSDKSVGLWSFASSFSLSWAYTNRYVSVDMGAEDTVVTFRPLNQRTQHTRTTTLFVSAVILPTSLGHRYWRAGRHDILSHEYLSEFSELYCLCSVSCEINETNNTTLHVLFNLHGLYTYTCIFIALRHMRAVDVPALNLALNNTAICLNLHSFLRNPE
jgi:hypothetical protein